MNLTDDTDGKTTGPRTPTERKPYATPQLVSYGHVKDIVQGSGGSKGDGAANMSRQ